MAGESALCKFRHLMKRHNFGDQMFYLANQYLAENGVRVNRGTIVDATIINAPASPRTGKTTGSGNTLDWQGRHQGYFGMKARTGVDSRTSLIRSVVATAANIHDSAVFGGLLHGQETRLWGDSAYSGSHLN